MHFLNLLPPSSPKRYSRGLNIAPLMENQQEKNMKNET